MTVLAQNSIRRSRPADTPAVVALLRQAGLPTEDFADAALSVWVLAPDGVVAGAVALEGGGSETRLLRSLVVSPVHRRSGHAQALVAYAEGEARRQGVEQVIVLTETAQGFFERLGYVPIERSAAPRLVQQSAEFRHLCPVSAVCLAKSLQNP
jgi:amino-acid N-acetyltransferase